MNGLPCLTSRCVSRSPKVTNAAILCPETYHGTRRQGDCKSARTFGRPVLPTGYRLPFIFLSVISLVSYSLPTVHRLSSPPYTSTSLYIVIVHRVSLSHSTPPTVPFLSSLSRNSPRSAQPAFPSFAGPATDRLALSSRCWRGRVPHVAV